MPVTGSILQEKIVGDERPMPSVQSNQDEDDALFSEEPWVEPPVRMDYGTNVRLAPGSMLNHNCTIIDTCVVSIGSRTLVGPNVSFFAGGHPLDPTLRNGLKGPEFGKEIYVGEDCWIGGNAIILPGVHIGRGATVGAGSVVTKDVAPFTVVAGNPARMIRKIKTDMDPEQKVDAGVIEQSNP